MFHMMRHYSCLGFAAIIISLAATVPAADLHVPLPYPTVQSAINAAVTGDTVQIAPGTYFENISIGGKNITIRAFNTNFDTIIDGGQAGSVVTFNGSESSDCVLRNLTLRNGKAAQGGGIKGNSTFATLRNCTITENTATGEGGGVYGFSGLIQNCTIAQNLATNGGGLSQCDGLINASRILQNKAISTGGGIYNTSGIIKACEIIANEAATAGGGFNQTEAIITGNLIQQNVVTATGPISTPGSHGGGINDARGTVTLNTIIENLSGGDGGGIANSPGLIQNNVIINNGARRGGGISASNGRIENNTIWGNRASHLAGGCLNLGSLVANCIIYNNSAPAEAQWSGTNVPAYSCVQAWAGGQADIITLDPQLADLARGRYNILPSSPCVDAGKFVAGLTIDFDGDSRPFNGTDIPRGDGSDIDIGADEYVPVNVDLAASWAIVKTKTKGKEGKLKTSIQGQLFVVSVGTDNVPAPFGIQFFLSQDPVWDPSDQAVGKFINVKKLKPGKAKKAKCKAKLPLNQLATGHYLIGVADAGNTIAEGDELNNVATYGPLP